MRDDLLACSGALFASGQFLLNMGSSKVAWWTGLGFVILGPLLFVIPVVVRLYKRLRKG